MKRKIFLLIFILIFAEKTVAYSPYRIIVDTEGRKVKISEKIERAVVLTPTVIEAIYICGEIEKVVGISNSFFNNPVYLELIKPLKSIPVISQSENDVNIEKLLALKPDILITIGPNHPSGMSNELIKRIEDFGIPVVLIDINSLEENYFAIELIGKIFRKEKKAKELIDYMKKILKHIQIYTKNIPDKKRPKVMLISGDKPTYVAGNYWGKQDIRVLAGGKVVLEDVKQFFAVISLERIMLLNPDVILISHAAKYSPQDILQNPQWKNICAVQSKRVYKNPYQIGGLFTPRVVLLLAWTAKKLHPEIDIDWVKIADDFFKKFYGLPYYGEKE